jgi:quinol monooxygenase YgiN
MTGGALRTRSPLQAGATVITSPIKIVAVLTARPGKADELRDLLDGMIAPSRAEPGNLRYDLWADPVQPGRFVLDELYENADAVAAHRASPHFQSYLAAINDLAARSAFLLDPLSVA